MSVASVNAGEFLIDRDGRRDRVFAVTDRGVTWIFWNGHVYRHREAGRGAAAHRGAAVDALAAPMPARVVKVLVKEGDRVAKGQTVVLLEAMKMELAVRAPADQEVSGIRCREGDLVQADQILVELR